MKAYRNIVARMGGVLLLAVVFVANTATAEAALVLRLTQGATVVEIADGDPGDANPADGAVTFIGAVGVFNINVTTGISDPNPVPATPNLATIDLNSVNSSTGAGTLLIELTDTDFPAMPFPGTLIGDVGGTTQGTAEFWAYKNDSNVEFDSTNPEASIHLGPFAPIGFVGSASAPHGALGVYSMTLVATITHLSAATTSFNFQVQNVPEPATLALFGIGLAGAAVVARRRKANR